MEELSLHILDIVENSIAAGAKHVSIRIRESRDEDLLYIEIVDDGIGMNEHMLEKAPDPFFTTRKTRRVGLGLALFEQAAKAAGGECAIASHPGTGTEVAAKFRWSHVDRQPLGNIEGTLLTLIVGNPLVEFSYQHAAGGSEVSFNTSKLKTELGDTSIQSPAGISIIKKHLEKLGQGGTHAVGSR